MKNGLEGSDFLYIALGGVVLYGAYRLFKPGGLFGEDVSVVAPAPFTTPVAGTGKTGSLFNFTPPTDYKIGQIPTLKQAAILASPVGSIEYGLSAIKEVTSSIFSRKSSGTAWVDPYIPGAPNFSTPQGAIFVDTSGKAPNFSSVSGKSVYIPPPSTPTGKPIYSSASSSSSSRVTGAPVGTRFSSGAYVKSSRASGKYKLF